jgi:transaldolase
MKNAFKNGVNIKKNCGSEIKGFTTNISFLKEAGIQNYEEFIKECLQHTGGRPISFQLYEDADEAIETIAKKIQSYDPSIYVKIPVIKTNNIPNSFIIKKLHDQGVQINVTVIFTKEQIDSLKMCFNYVTPVIISIFGGRINDSGLDCSDVVKHAVETFKEHKNVKILWAACRTIYNMFEAKNQGAHIVTVPDSVLSRMYRIKQTPEEAAIDTVNTFRNDGLTSKIQF